MYQKGTHFIIYQKGMHTIIYQKGILAMYDNYAARMKANMQR